MKNIIIKSLDPGTSILEPRPSKRAPRTKSARFSGDAGGSRRGSAESRAHWFTGESLDRARKRLFGELLPGVPPPAASGLPVTYIHAHIQQINRGFAPA